MSTPEEAAVAEAAVAALAPVAPAAAAGAPRAAAARCDNCGAGVAGRYCGNCGQRLEAPVQSLWHFLKIAFEDLTHADSRLWRTLWALLLKPGFLTREFLCGRRVRYLPPVRLYLVLSVAFFLWTSMGHRELREVQISTHDDSAPTARIVPQGDETASVFSPPLPGETDEQRTRRICSKMAEGEEPWLRSLLGSACPRIVRDNGRSFEEALMHNIPRAMFIFLPLIAAAMMLLYWRPRRYYVEHLLLLVHNHAFVFLAVLLVWPLTAPLGATGSLLRTAVLIYMVWYVYRSMRTVYGQGRALTMAKIVPLAFIYLASSLIMFLLTIAYSALTL